MVPGWLPDDTASNLGPADPSNVNFPQVGHGSIKLTVLFSAHELNQLLPAVDRVLYLGNRQAALGT